MIADAFRRWKHARRIAQAEAEIAWANEGLRLLDELDDREITEIRDTPDHSASPNNKS